MTFTPTSGDAFKTVPEEPSVQTFVLKNAAPGKPIDFTVAGTGSIPREQQGAPGGQTQGAAMGAQNGSSAPSDASTAGPGGGIGNPIDTPDPLSKYKWWILGGLALLLAAGAAFLLRKPAGATAVGSVPDGGATAYPVFGSAAAKHTQLLNALKEELFTLESEKINGAIAFDEYTKVKDALETVLKRALNRK
jgi:hypothetical protein